MLNDDTPHWTDSDRIIPDDSNPLLDPVYSDDQGIGAAYELEVNGDIQHGLRYYSWRVSAQPRHGGRVGYREDLL